MRQSATAAALSECIIGDRTDMQGHSQSDKILQLCAFPVTEHHWVDMLIVEVLNVTNCILMLNDRFKNVWGVPQGNLTIKWVKYDISQWHWRCPFLSTSCHFKKSSGLSGTLLPLTDGKTKRQIKHVYRNSTE